MKSYSFGERFKVFKFYTNTLKPILGLNSDYYIAVSYTYTGMYEFPVKKFFWTTSKDYEFAEMPELNDQHKEFINREASIFEGNPKKKLVTVKKEGEGKR